MKQTLTPGRLYALLASEFRQVCCAQCRNCSLPEPLPVEDPRHGEPTWVLGSLSRECEKCRKEIARIVRRNQAAYDLLDPLSHPVRFRAQVKAWQSGMGHTRH
jgi:hypothetical protein